MLGNRWLGLPILKRTLGVLLLILLASAVHAQNYLMLHSFQRTGDGAYPVAGLTMDRSGNLFGTASAGGLTQNCQGGCGTVFELIHKNGGWVFAPLYQFIGQSDGNVRPRESPSIKMEWCMGQRFTAGCPQAGTAREWSFVCSLRPTRPAG